MNIIEVIPAMGIGGAEIVTSDIAMDQHARGRRVTVASGPGVRITPLTAAGIDHMPVRLNSRRLDDLLRATAGLRRHIRNERPSVIHAHNVKATVVASLAARKRVPIITTLHGVPPHLIRQSARLLSRYSDAIVAVSPHVAEQLSRAGVDPAGVYVIENSIDTPRPMPRLAARSELGLSADASVALCVARMADQKRQDLLIEAWHDLPGSPILLLAGDGPNRVRLERQAHTGQACARIRFLGERTDIPRLMSAADVMVLPTDWEGLPISLLEALGIGLPAIVTQVGGVIETLGEAVRLVPAGSSAGLGSAIRELLTTTKSRQRLSAAGRELINERFSRLRMLDNYDALLRSVGSAGNGIQPIRTPEGSH